MRSNHEIIQVNPGEYSVFFGDTLSRTGTYHDAELIAERHETYPCPEGCQQLHLLIERDGQRFFKHFKLATEQD